MDFKQLEAFVYVVKLKSFSKAAQRIYLTQPTISAHINSLEKELDTKLIERGTKYVYPTKPGSILYQYAIKMLGQKLQQGAKRHPIHLRFHRSFPVHFA